MKWRILVTLSIAELLGMALWFSASAVTPALEVEWQLSDSGKAVDYVGSNRLCSRRFFKCPFEFV